MAYKKVTQGETRFNYLKQTVIIHETHDLTDSFILSECSTLSNIAGFEFHFILMERWLVLPKTCGRMEGIAREDLFPFRTEG